MKMNGENGPIWFNSGLALGFCVVIASLVFGYFYSNAKKGDEAITVTGSAKRRITSDLVVWSAGITQQAPQLGDAYKGLADNIPRIKQYLLSKGVQESQMTVSSIPMEAPTCRPRTPRLTSRESGISAFA